MRQVPHPAKALIVGRGERINEAATEVGCNPHTFGRVLNGYVEPWPALRQKLADHLGVSDAELWHDDFKAAS